VGIHWDIFLLKYIFLSKLLSCIKLTLVTKKKKEDIRTDTKLNEVSQKMTSTKLDQLSYIHCRLMIYTDICIAIE